MALDELSADLTDQAVMLAPLVPVDLPAATPLFAEGSSSGADTWLAELDHRLGQAGLVAQTDAMSPGLEATIVVLLSALAALYHARRQVLLVSTVLDAA